MEQTELEKKLAEAQATNDAMAKKLREITAKSRDAEFTAFCAEQKAKGVLIPAIEGKAVSLLKQLGKLVSDFEAGAPQLFTEAGGSTVVDAAKDLIASLPKQVNFTETVPQPAPAPAQTPGAPATQPNADTYTDGADRTYRVEGKSVMEQARTLMSKTPGLRLEDAVAQIQPGRKTAAL